MAFSYFWLQQLRNMQKIEHIGIAVKDLDQSEALYSNLFGTKPYKREVVESENVITSFFKVGPNKIELLQSLNPEGVIAKYVDKKGEGIHHIAYAVTDILSEMKRLEGEGFRLLSEHPKKGADNKWVCFLHPKTAGGVLVELCQEREAE